MPNWISIIEKLKSLAPAAAGAATVGGLATLDPAESEAFPRKVLQDTLRQVVKRIKELSFIEDLGASPTAARLISPTANIEQTTGPTHAKEAYKLLMDFAKGTGQTIEKRAGSFAADDTTAVGPLLRPTFNPKNAVVQSPLRLGPIAHEAGGHGLSSDIVKKLRLAESMTPEQRDSLVQNFISAEFTSEKSAPVQRLGQAIQAAYNKKKPFYDKAQGFLQTGQDELGTEVLANAAEYKAMTDAGSRMSPTSLMSYLRKSKDKGIQAALKDLQATDPEYLNAALSYDEPAKVASQVALNLKGRAKKLIREGSGIASAIGGAGGAAMAQTKGEDMPAQESKYGFIPDEEKSKYGFVPDKPVSAPTKEGLLVHGNIDLTKRPVVQNADGTRSTVRSMSFGEDGKEILVPTVSDDGRIISDQEAITTYHTTGKHLGIFKTPAAATAYAKELHTAYETGQIPGYASAQAPSKFGFVPDAEPVIKAAPIKTQPIPMSGEITAKVGEPSEELKRQVFAADAETAIPLASAAEAKRKAAWDAYTGGRGAALSNVNVGAPTRVSASEEYKTVSTQDLKDAAEGFKTAFLQTASTKGAVSGKDRLWAALETFKALNPVYTPAGNLVVQGVNRMLGRPQDIEEVLRMESETLPRTGNYAGSKVVDFVLQQIPGLIYPLGGGASKLAKGAKLGAKILGGAEKVAEGVKVGEGIAEGAKALTASERLIQLAAEAKAAKRTESLTKFMLDKLPPTEGAAGSVEELASRIKALHNQGFGQKFIAEQLGIGRQVVRTHLARLNVPTRTMEEGQELARAWHASRTEEEKIAARLETYRKSDFPRRKAGKGLSPDEIRMQRLQIKILEAKGKIHWDGNTWVPGPKVEGVVAPKIVEQPLDALYPDELAARGGLPRRGRKALLPGAPEIAEDAAELSSSGERGSDYLLKLAAENKAVKLSSEEKLRNLLLGKAPEKAETAGQAMDLARIGEVGTKTLRIAGKDYNIGKFGRAIQHTAFSSSDNLLRSSGAGAVVDPIERAFRTGRAAAQGTLTEIENVAKALRIERGSADAALVGQIINGKEVANASVEVRAAAQRIKPLFDKMRGTLEQSRPAGEIDLDRVVENIYDMDDLKNSVPGWAEMEAGVDAFLGKGKAREAFINTLPKHLQAAFKKGEINDVFDLGELYTRAHNRVVHDLPAYEKSMALLKDVPDGFVKEIAEDYLKGYLGDPNAGGTLMKAGKAVNAFYYRTLLGSNARSAWKNLSQTGNTIVEMDLMPTIKEAGRTVKQVFSKQFWGKDFNKLDDLLYQSGEFLDLRPGVEAAEEMSTASKAMKTVDTGLMYLFDRAEWINRKISFRTGYDAAIAKNLSHEAAIDKGLDVVKRCQFVYGRSSPVKLAQWPVVGQFGNFRAKQFEFMQKVLKDGLPDLVRSVVGGKHTEEGAKAGRLLALMLVRGGSTVYATGAVTAAFADMVSELWQSAGPGIQDTKDFGYWIARAARGNESFKNFAEEVAKRIPGVGGVYRSYNWLHGIAQDVGLAEPSKKSKTKAMKQSKKSK